MAQPPPPARIALAPPCSRLSLPCENATDRHSSFTPHRITLRNGFVILSDALSQAAFHVDMRTVHALVIDVISLDGVSYSSLHLYDTLGNLNFHLMAEGTHHAPVWRDLCENSFEEWDR